MNPAFERQALTRCCVLTLSSARSRHRCALTRVSDDDVEQRLVRLLLLVVRESVRAVCVCLCGVPVFAELLTLFELRAVL